MRIPGSARYTGRMPLPPPDKPAGPSANPARIMLNSPLAASMQARVYRRTRAVPRQRGLRVLGAIGTLFVHLLFLLILALGPAYEPLLPPPPPRGDFLRVRLVEPPEPPPPPPVRGTPPKERGPRHQGHRSQPAPSREHSANTRADVAQPTPAAAKPVVAQTKQAHAPTPKPAAAPLPPASLPKPAPAPDLQPVPLAVEPPTVTLPKPALQPPVPPSFQPESVRPPQPEGNQPMPPPASLALPDLPVQSAPSIAVSSIALNTEVPKTRMSASVTPIRAELSAAPPVPRLQPIPLPAQPSPSVKLQTQPIAPAPSMPTEQPQVQAPAISVAEAELEAVPVSPAPRQELPAAPAEKIDVAQTPQKIAVQTSIERPQLSTPAAAAPSPAETSQPAPSPSSASANAVPQEAAPNPGDASNDHDVSRAPDATPQGSDNAVPGEPDGVAAAPQDSGRATAAASPQKGQGKDNGRTGKQTGSGQPGGDQPGAEQGSKQGELGGYVQLKPHGDTRIMEHGAPNIGYKATRFDQDWTPEGESSVDTALRHAVEKTSVKHTFHLPRGVRVRCTVMPLLPTSLFSCGNADPPPKPVDAKVYERMHLAPIKPLAPPVPATGSTTAAPATMIKVDNSAECATARVAGGPLPPGCESIVLPVKPAAPASSSSSWVPASDQFH